MSRRWLAGRFPSARSHRALFLDHVSPRKQRRALQTAVVSRVGHDRSVLSGNLAEYGDIPGFLD
jgi:hypothetical protein